MYSGHLSGTYCVQWSPHRYLLCIVVTSQVPTGIVVTSQVPTGIVVTSQVPTGIVVTSQVPTVYSGHLTGTYCVQWSPLRYLRVQWSPHRYLLCIVVTSQVPTGIVVTSQVPTVYSGHLTGTYCV